MTTPLDSLIALLGPPRSGTTLIANAMISHPEASGIMEPYHVRRDAGYTETDPAALLRDFAIDCRATPHIFVKETTTREVNVTSTLELLRNARARGVYTGLVVILRCPLSAYLSQVEASRTMWKQKLMTEVSEETFDRFASSVRCGLEYVCLQARMQHFRIVSYEAFCARPETELARLMALVPLRLNAKQLGFAPPDKIVRGGDPKTRAKSGQIALISRDGEVAELRRRFASRPWMRFFERLRAITLEKVGSAPDSAVMDDLTRLMLQYRGG